jgi:copper chaperone CopZ
LNLFKSKTEDIDECIALIIKKPPHDEWSWIVLNRFNIVHRLWMKEKAIVKTYANDLPTMYGDHHVVEVRRILMELPGVEDVYASSSFQDVYASSSFQLVEVEYDETKLDPEQIEAILEEQGYLGELPVPVERGVLQDQQNGDKPFFRTTAAYKQTGLAVSFAQKVPPAGRPLWPCPGMGPLSQNIEIIEEEAS